MCCIHGRSQNLKISEVWGGVNPLGSTPAATRFVADFPDKAEKSLNYPAIFDCTDKRNTPFKSVWYTHNNN